MVVFGKITFTQKILSNVLLTFAWHFTAYRACMLTCLLESLSWRTHRPVVPKVALASPGEFGPTQVPRFHPDQRTQNSSGAWLNAATKTFHGEVGLGAADLSLATAAHVSHLGPALLGSCPQFFSSQSPFHSTTRLSSLKAI